jgi:hypothetical protein
MLARVVSRASHSVVQVLFEGKPVAEERIKAYPEASEPIELRTDDHGLATIPEVAEGKTALWANWIESKPGEVGGKTFSET